MSSVLIVVDYQVDFVSGALGFAGAEALARPIAARIRKARQQGETVAFTMDTHPADYLETLEGRNLPIPHCIADTPGWKLEDTVGRELREEDPVFRKPTFPSLELGEWLREKDFDRVELCGLVSHMCVLSNAVMAKAALPQAEIILDAALTASFDPVLHEKALDLLESLQITVLRRERKLP